MTRLRSVTTRPIVAAISSVDAADDRADVGGGRRLLEERVHARDQVDAGGHHRRGVDQGGDRRRALHGVREPGVQRDLGGLRERADQQQRCSPPRGRRRCARTPRRPRRTSCRKSSVPVPLEDEVRAEHEPDVADHVDDERLDAGRASPSCAGTRTRSAGRTPRRRTPSRRSAARSCRPGPAAACRTRRSSGTRRSACSRGRRPCRRPSRGGSASRRRRRPAP